MKNVLITGGTGTLGTEIVTQMINDSIHQVSILSSQKSYSPPQSHITHGNLATNEGLYEALENTDIIIHCASNPKDALNVDLAGTANLLNAINKNKKPHLIYISIVGVDKSAYPYYNIKAKVEKMIAESGVPFSVLRTTQFHNFVLSMIQSFPFSNGHLMVPKGMRFQSIDIKDVANRLIKLTGEEPSGLLPDMGGPEILGIREMVMDYQNVFGKNDTLEIAVTNNERHNLFRTGINLCNLNIDGKITWEQFLHRQFNIYI